MSVESIDAEGAGDWNQNAGVAAEVVAPHCERFVSTKRQVNAEARNYEEHNDSRRSEYNALPGVSEESSKRSGGVYTGKDWKDFVVANGDPEGQNKAQSVQDGIVTILSSRVVLYQATHPSRIFRENLVHSAASMSP